MQRLPFNPEALLALFMPKESAVGLAGDLEERFQRIRQRKGWVRATAWFWWALLSSMPPVLIEAVGLTASDSRSLACSISGQAAVEATLTVVGFTPYVADECQKGDECQGSIRWECESLYGGSSGFCEDCGAVHLRCGHCGTVGTQEADDILQCNACNAYWIRSLAGIQEFTF